MRGTRDADSTAGAAVAERERIGQELRDGVIRKLFAAGLTLQCALTLIDDTRAAERVTATIEELDAVIREIRDTVAGVGTVVAEDDTSPADTPTVPPVHASG